MPCARIRRFDEAVNDPQMASRQVFHHFDGEPGTVAGMTSTLAGFSMSEAGPSLDFPPQPLGAQTDEILAGLGYPAAEIAAMRATGIVA